MTELDIVSAAPGATLRVVDDFEAINQLYLDRGWGDGLPIVPPTVARVEAMLRYCPRPWNEVVARIAPRWGEATPLRLAANAVMAGCRPEYFPLFMLAIEAMCDAAFNLYGIQTTTHQCAPLVIVNGPIARELNINAGHNAFGPGRQSNASIGRAVRLALVNIGGAIPGTVDMATFGSPAKYAYCIAENEADSPWEPLHVERGFLADTSTVTVVGCEGPHNISEHESITAEGLLWAVAQSMSSPGSNNATQSNIDFVGEPMVVLSPEHAKVIAAGGYTKARVKEYLYQHARVPVRHYSDESIERRLRNSGRFDDQLDIEFLDRKVPLARSPDDFMVIVLGGVGKHSAFIPSLAVTRSVTRALLNAQGQPVRSVEEFRSCDPAWNHRLTPID